MVTKKKSTLIPVKELVATQADQLKLGNVEIADATGYKSGNVIAMLKAGTMRLPMNKVSVMARVLHLDPLYLAMCVDAESGGGLSSILELISKRTPITANEERLIMKLREIASGHDFDLADYPQEYEAIQKTYASAAEREITSHTAHVERLKNRKRSALANADRKAALEEEQARKAA